MYPLSAIVPEGREVPRSRIVPERLARKVAPLFGVRWEGNPFDSTWLCGLDSLTLTEVGRGAPLPSREEQERLDAARAAGCLPPAPPGPAGPAGADAGPPSWRFAGRGVWTPDRTALPGSLANATMNRYGPHTKCAVVLVAGNCLFEETTRAVGAVCEHLASTGASRDMRLAVWGGLVLEAFRAHPALGVAVIQARAVQRSLTARWGENLTSLPPDRDGARSELSARFPEGTGGAPDRPTRLALLDGTLPLLGLRADPPGPAGSAGGTGPDRGSPLGGERLDDIVDGWCRRLVRVGRQGRGLLWVVEEDGHRTVRAYVRTGAVVAPFVAETLGAGDGAGAVVVPPLPDTAHLTGLPRATVRAHLLAAHVAVRYLRYRDELLCRDPGLRERTREHTGRALELARDLLGPHDPVTVLLSAYDPYLRLRDLLALPGTDPTGRATRDAVDPVLRAQEEVLAAGEAGRIDPGTVTYLTEIMNISLERTVLRVRVAGTGAGSAAGTGTGTGTGTLPPRSVRESGRAVRNDPVRRIDGVLARSWPACLSARGLDANTVLADPDAVPAAQAFHLLHFAVHMGRRGSTKQVRGALDLMDRIAGIRERVAAGEPAAYAVKHTAARVVHELAARTALALAERLRDHGADPRAARESALRHAVAGLRNPSVVGLVEGEASLPATRDAARCLLPAVVDSLCAGVSGGQPPAGRAREPAVSGPATVSGPAMDGELFARTRELLRAALRPAEPRDGPAGGPGDLPGDGPWDRAPVLGTVEPEVLRDRLIAAGLWYPPGPDGGTGPDQGTASRSDDGTTSHDGGAR